MIFNFVVNRDYENISTTKFSRFTVYRLRMCMRSIINVHSVHACAVMWVDPCIWLARTVDYTGNTAPMHVCPGPVSPHAWKGAVWARDYDMTDYFTSLCMRLWDNYYECICWRPLPTRAKSIWPAVGIFDMHTCSYGGHYLWRSWAVYANQFEVH